MTVSTAGIVPRIYDFGREPVLRSWRSLNGSNDTLRSEVMPRTGVEPGGPDEGARDFRCGRERR